MKFKTSPSELFQMCKSFGVNISLARKIGQYINKFHVALHGINCKDKKYLYDMVEAGRVADIDPEKMCNDCREKLIDPLEKIKRLLKK